MWYGIKANPMIGRDRVYAGNLRALPLVSGAKHARIVLLDDIIASWDLYGITPEHAPWAGLRRGKT